MAVSRLGGCAVRGVVGVAVLLTAYPPNRLTAQDSQFGIQGLGTPGRFESVRARSTAGAFTPFDPLSPLSEAPLADLSILTATAMSGTSYRESDFGGSTASLRSTRFPLLSAAGRVAPRLALAAGFTTYLDKSWDVTQRDSFLLRGVLQRYTDELTSDGSVADVRFVAASRLNRRIAIGGGIHLLTGSTRQTAERRFDDTTFHTVQQLAEVRKKIGTENVAHLYGNSVAPFLRAAKNENQVLLVETGGWRDSDRIAAAHHGSAACVRSDLYLDGRRARFRDGNDQPVHLSHGFSVF